MAGVDFTEADVSKGIFNECDLLNAVFLNTNLTKTNVQTAHNYSIDIRSIQVNKAVVSNTNLEGFLKGEGLDIRNLYQLLVKMSFNDNYLILHFELTASKYRLTSILA